MATKKKLVHNIESSKLPPPQRLGREAVRSFLRELDDLVGIHLTKIRDITPNYNTSREKTTTLLLTTVKTFLRIQRRDSRQNDTARFDFDDSNTAPTATPPRRGRRLDNPRETLLPAQTLTCSTPQAECNRSPYTRRNRVVHQAQMLLR